MTSDTALYIGEAGDCLSDGTPLIPGVTIAHVPEGEAILSDRWDPIDATRPADSVPPSEYDGGTPRSSTPIGFLDGGTP